jgi:hypothetical protein
MADSSAKPKPRKNRRWLRRFLYLFLFLLLAVIIFHRPLIHHGGRWVAIWLAKREHITLDLRLGGNVWNRFEIHDLQAKADGTGPAPIEHATIDRAVVEYDLLKLIKGDLNGLRLVDVGKVDAVVTPQPSNKPKKPSKPLAEQIRTFLNRPLPATQVRVGRVDIRVKENKGDVIVRGLEVALGPGSPGKVRWERVEIPGLPPLESSAGSTEVASEKLLLANMTIWPELRVTSVRVERAQDGRPIELAIEAEIAGGTLSATVQPQPTGNDFIAKVRVETRDAAAIARRFGVELPFPVELISAEADWRGDPEAPATSQGRVVFSATGNKSTVAPGWTLSGTVNLAEGKVAIPAVEVRAAESVFTANGNFDIAALLAHKGPGKPPLPEGTLWFQTNAPDLAKAAAQFNQQAKGQIEANGAVTLSTGVAVVETTIKARDLGHADLSIGVVNGKATARIPLGDTMPLPGLTASVEADLERIAAGEAQADRARISANIAQLQATLRELVVVRGSNQVHADGKARLTAEGKFAEPPTVQFTIEAPALIEFGVKVKDAPLAGAVRGNGTLSFVNENPTGVVQVTGSDLQIGTARAGSFVIDLTMANGTAELKNLRADFNATDHLDATGRVTLKSPNAYDGKLALQVRDLAAFQPILDVLGQKQKIGGSLKIDWTGSGDLSKHQGDGKVTAQNVKMDTLQITEARLAATYTPDRANVPEFLVVADQLRASGELAWAEKRLNLKGLEVQLAGRPVITGELSAPLDPSGKSVLPADMPITGSFAARNLDLARIFRELKLKAPIEGTVTATLNATGTLAAPVIKLDAQGRGMRLPVPADAELTEQERATYNNVRGEFDSAIAFEKDQLSVSTTVRHPELKPLKITAEAPLKLQPILEGKVPDWKTIPFKAAVDLPASSLAFLPKMSPAVTRVEGTLAIDIDATGTVNEPRLSGLVTSDIKFIRMANSSIPPMSNFAARIRLSDKTVTIDRLGGETGGGKFSVSGRINADNLAQPTIDLAVKTDKVLAMRNDSVLVRVDADVTLRGPVNAGTAAGRVVIAQSRFNKEIQILPILMPGRPKPVPREVSQPMTISFPNPPLRDWKFDIAIVTINEDPFVVRGNLAKGRVSVDLRLQGTGLNPYLVGAASIEQFSAQLPVSTLTTRRGLVMFSQENPFEPRLELETETVIRGYTIIARLDGPASAPRLDLSSEPPLPQQEIMSLLTTGSLAGEIGENNSALATRAGLIVLREWYKKIFKKDLPVPSDEGGDNFFQRFSVDLGAVDSKTGRQEVVGQFRVTDRVRLIGEIGMDSTVGGRIQYVFRFK